jgi:hypothetical protein
MRCEGGTTVCGFRHGEENCGTRSTNDAVNTLRISTWDRAMTGSRLRCTTVAERQDWTEDDPRWRCFKLWIHENQDVLREEAAVFGVVVKTIRRYLDYTTFKTVVRDRAPEAYSLHRHWQTRSAQRSLQFAEINTARRILREHVPRVYWHPRNVALAERFIGSPEEGADGRPKHGRSAHVRQVIFRTLRRLLNATEILPAAKKGGFKSGQRGLFVRPDNLSHLAEWSAKVGASIVVERVQAYVAEQKRRAGASRALIRLHSRIHSPFRRWQRQTVSSRPTKRRRTLYPHPGNWI